MALANIPFYQPQPQRPSLVERAGQMLQFKNQMTQQQETQRQLAANESVRQAFAQGGSPTEMLDRLRQIDPDAYMTYGLQFAQQANARLTQARSQLDLLNSIAEATAKTNEEGRADVWPRLREHAIQAGIPGQMVPMEFDEGLQAQFKYASDQIEQQANELAESQVRLENARLTQTRTKQLIEHEGAAETRREAEFTGSLPKNIAEEVTSTLFPGRAYASLSPEERLQVRGAAEQIGDKPAVGTEVPLPPDVEAQRIRMQKAVQAQNQPLGPEVIDFYVKNPQLLAQATPTERSRVTRAIAESGRSDEFSRASQESSMLLIQQAEDTLARLVDHPGMGGAVGAKGPTSLFGVLDRPVSGTSASDFAVLVDKLKSQLTIPALDALRGLGHMSDREFAAITSSVAALDRSMSESEFKNEMQSIAHNLAYSRARAELGFEYGGRRYSFNTRDAAANALREILE